MFEWLFEGQTSVLVVLGAVLIVLSLAWWYYRRRGLLIAAGVTAALLVLYLGLDFLVETDREAGRRQIRERVLAMADSAEKGDAEGVLRYVSDHFQVQSTDKQRLRSLVEQARSQVPKVRIDQFDFGDGPHPAAGSASVRFMVRSDHGNYRCDTVFDYDASHGWRIRSLKLYGPQPRQEEFPLPW